MSEVRKPLLRQVGNGHGHKVLRVFCDCADLRGWGVEWQAWEGAVAAYSEISAGAITDL